MYYITEKIMKVHALMYTTVKIKNK